ncbi:MAG: hypothetical protein V7K97_14575 [Nostoc sp.]
MSAIAPPTPKAIAPNIATLQLKVRSDVYHRLRIHLFALQNIKLGRVS